MSAAGAAVAMPTQRSRAAARDGQQHLLVLPVDPTCDLCSINACPAQRTMSAISTRGLLFNCAWVLPVKRT